MYEFKSAVKDLSSQTLENEESQVAHDLVKYSLTFFIHQTIKIIAQN